MTETSRRVVFAVLAAELAIVIAIFWRYGSDWGNETVLVAAFLAPVFLAAYAALRPAGARDSSSIAMTWPSRLIMTGVWFGLAGMLFALVVGSHLAASAAIYAAILQSVLFLLALWRLRRSPAQKTGSLP